MEHIRLFHVKARRLDCASPQRDDAWQVKRGSPFHNRSRNGHNSSVRGEAWPAACVMRITHTSHSHTKLLCLGLTYTQNSSSFIFVFPLALFPIHPLGCSLFLYQARPFSHNLCPPLFLPLLPCLPLLSLSSFRPPPLPSLSPFLSLLSLSLSPIPFSPSLSFSLSLSLFLPFLFFPRFFLPLSLISLVFCTCPPLSLVFLSLYPWLYFSKS